jgi:Kdo2-lipid IVA lauroyltransferase/acyltransferase
MESKHLVRYIRRKTAYAGLVLSSLIMRVVREKDIYRVAGVFAALGYRLAAKLRTIALGNLTLAFRDQKTPQEREKIVRDSFLCMAKSGLEILYVIEHPRSLIGKISLEGQEHLDKALSKGKGVIAAGLHLGNFPLQEIFLSQRGYKVNYLIRHMRDPSADAYFLKKRSELGLKTIYSEPRRQSVFQCLRALKNNEILCILMDQNFGTGGVFVEFFGMPAATATGPVVLARRSQAALVPMFIVRNSDDTMRLIVEEELALEEKGDDDATILWNVQRVTSLFETYIRRYPAEWSWIHRRWKTRPSP